MAFKEIHEIIQDIGVSPVNEHVLTYETYSESLEPVYYFILDLMQDDFGLEVEKLVDNFSPAEGSGQSQEIGQKKGIMQQQASQNMERINAVTRSILNINYDLKELRTRLNQYDDLHSDKKSIRQASLHSLKQIWVDRVDMQKGNSSIAGMVRQLGFQTLFDAFFFVNEPEDAEKLDLNERVKRTVKSRIAEFNQWVESSERELRKRFQMQKTYLKTQVNNLKLYSRWARPYFRAAHKLEAKDQGRNPEVVNVFNRTLIELTLLGKKKLNIKDSADGGNLPKDLSKDKYIRTVRDYYSCTLLDFNFRTVPQQGGVAYTGRVDVTFRGYALNKDQIKKLDEKIKDSDIENVFELIDNSTEDSLGPMADDIKEFLDDEEKDSLEFGKKEEKKKKKSGSNPFIALFGGYNSDNNNQDKAKDKKKEKSHDDKENFLEKEHLRPLAEETAEKATFKIFDVYKKAHGMPSYT